MSLGVRSWVLQRDVDGEEVGGVFDTHATARTKGERGDGKERAVVEEDSRGL